MTEFKFEVNGTTTDIYTPYNPDFVYELKQRIGSRKFDNDKKCWTIKTCDLEMAKEIVDEIYGWTEEEPEFVRAKLTFLYGMEGTREPIWIGGKYICAASSRDSGAMIGDGISILKGGATSGGSIKNWQTVIREGTEMLVLLPKRMVDRLIADSSSGLNIEIYDTPDPDQAALEAEKKYHLERIAAIDELLENMSDKGD